MMYRRYHRLYIICTILQAELCDDAGHAGVAVEGPQDETDVHADALVVAFLAPEVT